MEGSENIKRNKQLIKLIIIFHLVGLAGLAISFSRPLFLQLVPYHLFFMMIIIVISHQQINARFLIFLLSIGIAGFTAEWFGVNKALLFGNYTYGTTLGAKWGGVPLIMAFNWFLLIYSTGALLGRSRIKNPFMRTFLGAIILVLLDILIEPVAGRLNYWNWQNGSVPLKNYVCWFLIGGLLLAGFETFRFKKQGVVAPVLLIAQFVFFAVLNL